MSLAGAVKASALVSWKSTGSLQNTIASCIKRTGKALHSGEFTTVKISPEVAGKGRYFEFRSTLIPASINYVQESALCTTLRKDGLAVRTVEHLLSALEAMGVDNCKILIEGLDNDDQSIEVPIFDGSSKEWVDAIEQVGLKTASDLNGNDREKMAPFINAPIHVCKGDSFVAAFPSSDVRITYGIDFPQVPAIGCQWFSTSLMDRSFYSKEISSSRTFCVYEEVQRMKDAGLIKGGSAENAIICSASRGWLNGELRFPDEPCRHKILDIIGDLSLLASSGNQGFPLAHIVAYKAGHSLHASFARELMKRRAP
ncbi:probable UDP-3-O-acyl-N-acetylglucosamine deacetylase 1, mitochondrial isoform X2 [Impatiens glandulifera]|uniref:probable UDP-3-O-acyl-N-acetylglucosamine deacetylase 1, mitochondrial isoform X2 n=1 Tax=Impatiens glandulifera TaxID=253017 RepID=UPI001FB09050|nr:probable UDP-3-O-acyl-N-acetylglucosamine deacetylase 1, mitochondrial isoform X2 [Impatiens glandulifera]